MALINPTLFKPRNALVIVAVAAVAHTLARPLYKAVGSKGS